MLACWGSFISSVLSVALHWATFQGYPGVNKGETGRMRCSSYIELLSQFKRNHAEPCFAHRRTPYDGAGEAIAVQEEPL